MTDEIKDTRPLREKTLRIALLKTLRDVVDAEYEAERERLFEVLLDEWEQSGTTSVALMLPDDTKLGTLPLTAAKEKLDVDEVQLLAWAKENRPDALEEVVIPPTPEQRFTQWRPGQKTALLKTMKYDAESDLVITEDGTVVEGVTHVPAGKPTSYQVRVSAAGKDKLMAEYRQGKLAHIEQGIPLNTPPEIEQQERAPWE